MTAEPVRLPNTRTDPLAPPPELAELRATAPIIPLRYPDGHIGWLVTSYALARQVLGDPRFSNRNEYRHWPVPLPRGSASPTPTPPGMFSRLDPPEHGTYRRLLAHQFSAKRMAELESHIEQIADELLGEMAGHGSPADLVEAYTLPIPSLVICEMLGVSYAERARFQRDSATLFDMKVDATASGRAWASLHGYVSRLIARKRIEPADDLLSLLAASDLPEHELTMIGLTLLIAGHETTANQLALGMLTLLRNPVQRAAFQADPGLVTTAVEELMRHQTVVHHGPVRAALTDAEIGGVRVRAGQVVTVSLPAANRDPARFPDPDLLDLARDGASHLGFGHGPHQCLGQQLARVEMRVAFTALFRRYPDLRLAVPAEQVPMRADMGIYGVHQLPVAWS